MSEEFTSKGVAVWLVNATPQNDPSDSETRHDAARWAASRLSGRWGTGATSTAVRELVPESVLGDRETLRRETMQYVWGLPPLPPVLRDEHQFVSRFFGVTRTCEAIVIDTKAMSVVYRGGGG